MFYQPHTISELGMFLLNTPSSEGIMLCWHAEITYFWGAGGSFLGLVCFFWGGEERKWLASKTVLCDRNRACGFNQEAAECPFSRAVNQGFVGLAGACNWRSASPHSGKWPLVLTLTANLTAECGLAFQSPSTLQCRKIANAEKQWATPRGGWERFNITFWLHNSLYAHHFDASNRKVLRPAPIISRRKCLRNCKMPQVNFLYFYTQKYKITLERGIQTGFLPSYIQCCIPTCSH